MVRRWKPAAQCRMVAPEPRKASSELGSQLAFLSNNGRLQIRKSQAVAFLHRSRLEIFFGKSRRRPTAPALSRSGIQADRRQHCRIPGSRPAHGTTRHQERSMAPNGQGVLPGESALCDRRSRPCDAGSGFGPGTGLLPPRGNHRDPADQGGSELGSRQSDLDGDTQFERTVRASVRAYGNLRMIFGYNQILFSLLMLLLFLLSLTIFC